MKKSGLKRKNKKVVLAYSGGLDTSVIVKWLQLKGYDVICFVADVGQKDDFQGLKAKALASGAKKLVVADLKKEFIEEYVYPAIQFNALYEGRYLLGTALARPVIAKHMVALARKERAASIAHGATGKGNDQVRFELTAYALMPQVKIIAPWRDPEFTELIKGRKQAIAFAKEHKIPIKATASKPWSSDENIHHISFEAGMLEDPMAKPLETMFEYSLSPHQAPDKTVKLSLEFKAGIPFSINSVKKDPLSLMRELNEIGGENGVGRIDIVESRFVGMKSRGVYETPGATILLQAHRDLEGLTLDRDVIELKDTLMPRFSKLVYNGFWYSHEMHCLLAMVRESQKKVTGRVYLEIYKGNVIVVGRESEHSLYDEKVASMDDDHGAYDQRDASGFIRLKSLPLRVAAKRHRP